MSKNLMQFKKGKKEKDRCNLSIQPREFTLSFKSQLAIYLEMYINV